MTRYQLLACGLISLTASVAMAADKFTPPKLTVTQIIDKNMAARGGLKTWQAINTLTMSGLLEAGGTKNTQLPFVMEMKRQHKSRLEIRFEGQTAVQVYDGEHGWKLRPFLGRSDVEPFTEDEAKAAAAWDELDGPLVDYAKKGTRVQLLGTESVEGHPTYKLKLTMNDGQQRRLWIDAKSFLERKIDGQPRKMDGKLHDVAIFYRDYKKENGLTVPHTFETVVTGTRQSYKMTIDQVKVNQPLEDTLFDKPQLAMTTKSAQ